MYILFTGFSLKEQRVIQSWSKNRSKDFGEGFSVGNSVYLGRIVEVEKSFLNFMGNKTLKEMIVEVRKLRYPDTNYLNQIKEIRIFYNQKLNCIFSVKIKETENGLIIELVRIPFSIFFTMVDKKGLTAFLNVAEKGKIISDDEIELVEIGFLSRYLVCNEIDETTVFLFEGKDYEEFRKTIHFVKILGDKTSWQWRDNKIPDIDEENDCN